jgi:hypothetical protein
VVESEAGELACLSSKHFTVAQGAGGELTFSNESQPDPWQVSVLADPKAGQMTLHLKVNFSGLEVTEALNITRFSQALARGGDFRIIGKILNTDIDIPILLGGVAQGAYPGPDARWVELIEQLSLVQGKTGVRLTIPKGEIDLEEAKTIANVAGILKTGHATYKAKPWTVESNLEQAKKALEQFASGEPAPTAIHYQGQAIKIFGVEVPLGPVTLFCDRTIITKEDQEKLRIEIENQPPDATVHSRFTPFEGCPIEARYINWLPADEAVVLRSYPMYRMDTGTPDASEYIQRRLEGQLKERLFDKGYVREVRQPITDFTPYRNRVPVAVGGKPLSETVVEERR